MVAIDPIADKCGTNPTVAVPVRAIGGTTATRSGRMVLGIRTVGIAPGRGHLPGETAVTDIGRDLVIAETETETETGTGKGTATMIGSDHGETTAKEIEMANPVATRMMQGTALIRDNASPKTPKRRADPQEV